jgi:enoyl-[acyl-carrier protein] reductase I
MLAGKRILVTGVVTRDSIAFAVARRAQEAGAEVILSGFGRARRLTERAAAKLPAPAPVIELDVNQERDLKALPGAVGEHWETLDGVLHAIAFAPPDALGGAFLDTPVESALSAFRTSAYSLKALTAALRPLLERAEQGGSVVALDFDASVAWPVYDWMGVAKAGLESVARYLARDLGADGIRINLVAAGPIETVAASGIAGFAELAAGWPRVAPLGWDARDAGPVADAACFLLSPLARGITGEILHVDGGYHAIGAPAAPDAGSGTTDGTAGTGDPPSRSAR